MADVIRETPDGVMVSIKVIPRAQRDEIMGVENDAIKVRLNAPPVDGRANEALIRFLAETLGIPRAQVEILRGETSRQKVVRVRGITVTSLRAKLHLK